MRNIARKAKAGFTLIELMVVILILGLLATAIGVAVVSVISENKNKLDAQSLSTFVDRLVLKVAETKSKRAIEAIKRDDDGTARQLFIMLYQDDFIKIEEIKKLAGSSGAAGDETHYGEDPAGTAVKDDMIIFTSTSNSDTLVELLTAKGKEAQNRLGVSFCYNKRFMEENAKDGCIIIMAGEKKAESMNAAVFKAQWKAISDTDVKFDFTKSSDVFGSEAFVSVKEE